MSDLTDFLLARITEDEPVGRDWQHNRGKVEVIGGGDGYLRLCDPARVLAECEAKRRIVERAVAAERAADLWTEERLRTDTRSPIPEWARHDAFSEVLRDLARAYKDHPDYREEWTP